MPEPTTHPLKPGDKVLHPFNRELGPGVVEQAGGRRLTVLFPTADVTLTFAAETHPLVPLTLQPGADPEHWADEFQDDVVARLARRDADELAAFRNRLDATRLRELR
ncbi:MAG: hypothetical protein KC591_13805, partial [Gemmatimonadetes bacterium]|nr:hypothetical protein [Gemmatimonadota bacterium]